MGGTGVVKPAVESQLKGLSKAARLGGKDRYETLRLVAEWELKNGLAAVTPAVATGANFPDALAGAALQGKNRSVMVLAANPSSRGIASGPLFPLAHRVVVPGCTRTIIICSSTV